MQHITGISRHQMRFSSLKDTISPDNQVRFIDAFVELIDISKLDFAIKTLKTEGRPSFNSKVLLKMYLCGYLNGVRSGRDLEKECFRNIEIQRLLEGIRPNYHNITAFGKYPTRIKEHFQTICFVAERC
jgi:transposase